MNTSRPLGLRRSASTEFAGRLHVIEAQRSLEGAHWIDVYIEEERLMMVETVVFAPNPQAFAPEGVIKLADVADFEHSVSIACGLAFPVRTRSLAVNIDATEVLANTIDVNGLVLEQAASLVQSRPHAGRVWCVSSGDSAYAHPLRSCCFCPA